MQKAAGMIAISAKKTGGLCVVYRRGATAVEVIAAKGRSDIEDEGVDLESITANAADWLIDPADLVIDGSKITPTRGDKIEWAGRTWEVVQRGEKTSWRYVDQGEKMFRIFTIEVNTV